jgi:polar amino acid transport system substrate-binding protein
MPPVARHNELEMALLLFRVNRAPRKRPADQGETIGDESAHAPAIHFPAWSGVRPAASTGSDESDLRSLATFRSVSSRPERAESLEQAVAKKRATAPTIRMDFARIDSMPRVDCERRPIECQGYRKQQHKSGITSIVPIMNDLAQTVPKEKEVRTQQMGRLLLIGLVTVPLASAAIGQARIGDCTVSGQKGTYPIKPAIRGQLTVETGLPAPGWWNGESPDTIRDGFEYCMAAYIAYRGGLDKVVVVNVSFAQLLGGQTRNFDLALTQASITEERKKAVDFSIPYFASDIGVLVRKGTRVDAQAMKNFRIGVQQATTAVDFAADRIKPTQPLRVYPGLSATYAALGSGQVDAVVYDTAQVLNQAALSGGTMTVVAQYSTGESYGAIFAKGSPNEAAINKIIQSLQDDGTLRALSAQYLAKSWGVDPAKIPYLKP